MDFNAVPAPVCYAELGLLMPEMVASNDPYRNDTLSIYVFLRGRSREGKNFAGVQLDQGTLFLRHAYPYNTSCKVNLTVSLGGRCELCSRQYSILPASCTRLSLFLR